jgi:hypothetical protein
MSEFPTKKEVLSYEFKRKVLSESRSVLAPSVQFLQYRLDNAEFLQVFNVSQIDRTRRAITMEEYAETMQRAVDFFKKNILYKREIIK